MNLRNIHKLEITAAFAAELNALPAEKQQVVIDRLTTAQALALFVALSKSK